MWICRCRPYGIIVGELAMKKWGLGGEPIYRWFVVDKYVEEERGNDGSLGDSCLRNKGKREESLNLYLYLPVGQVAGDPS